MKLYRKNVFLPCLVSLLTFQSFSIAEEKVVVVSTVNGLCNRLRVLASGSIIAEETNRTLQVYWDSPFELAIVGNAKWEDLFTSPTFHFVHELPKEGGIFNMKRPTDPPGLVPLEAEIILKTKTANDKENAILHSNSPGAELAIDVPKEYDAVVFQCIYNLKLKSMSDDTYYQKKRDFYKKLEPVPYVKEAVEKISATFSSRTVGVHVRTTDLIEHCWNGKNPAYEKYVQAMREELKKDPKTKFFLSADSKKTLQYFLAAFGDKIIYYPDVAYHTEGPFKDCAERGTLKAQRDALIDLYLLSKTSKLIGTKHSSFSYEAACMGGLEMIEIDHQ